MKKAVGPILKGYKAGPSVLVWCPFCAKWHSHGLTQDLRDGKVSHRVADCGHYDKGYYVSLFTKSELKEIMREERLEK